MNYADMIPVPTFGIEELSHAEVIAPEPPPQCNFITQLPQLSHQAMKIARAKTGASEIRLLRTLSDGKPSGFALQTAVLAPYSRDQKDLAKEDTKEPLTEAEALAAFEKAVAEKYPASTLRNGRSVPTYLSLL